MLAGISMSLEKGEMVALMGPSGSGKSTLLNIIGCLDRASGGSYVLEEREVTKEGNGGLEEIRRTKVGFVFQDFNLLPRLSALSNVELPLIYQGVGAHERSRRAGKLLRELGLGERLSHRPYELSGGEKQRVAIARALITNPVLVLADEPTGNLDTKKGTEVMELIKSEHKKRNVSVLLVTHDMNIAGFADRIIRLQDGQIVA